MAEKHQKPGETRDSLTCMHTDDLGGMSSKQVDVLARQSDRILLAEVDECTELSVALAEHLISFRREFDFAHRERRRS